MWQLSMSNAAKEWTPIDTFSTVTAAAGRIREIEGYLNTSVLLELHVDTELGTDLGSFSDLHHTGRKAFYGIRRRRH